MISYILLSAGIIVLGIIANFELFHGSSFIFFLALGTMIILGVMLAVVIKYDVRRHATS